MMTVSKENVFKISIILNVHLYVYPVISRVDYSLESRGIVSNEICVLSVHAVRIAFDINTHDVLLILA
jgi:hypothetical protein